MRRTRFLLASARHSGLTAVGWLVGTLVLAAPAFCGWRTFTTFEGLAGDTVYCVQEAHTGAFWIGTNQGASLHDGSTWRIWTAADGLGEAHVRTILEDRTGHVWFGHGLSGAGVSRYDGATWQTFTTADGLADDNVSHILEDRAGNLWFATQRGVSRFDGLVWRTFTVADGLADDRVSCILEDRAGNLWFGTKRGASCYDGSTWRTFTAFDGLAKSDVRTIYEDRTGALWFAFGTALGGVSRFDGSNWHTTVPGNDLPSSIVYCITEDASGAMWFGTDAGASRFYNSLSRTYTTADGLGNRSVYSILEDRSGALWFGTVGGGVSRYDGSTWRTFTVADGLASNRLFCAAKDRAENLWFGTSGGGVSRYDGVAWQNFTTADGLGGDGVFSAIMDRTGDLWFGTDGGASRYDGSTWRTFTTADGLAGDRVYCMLEDRAGNFWFGFRGYGGGVSRYDGTTWQTFTTADGLGNDNVSCILEDRAGNLWFGTSGGGVSRYDGSAWRTFTTADGLASNYVSTILEDRSGNLWFGTSASGLSRYDGSIWRTFTTADGLASNSLSSMLEDQFGVLWFGTGDGGLSRYDGSMWRSLTTTNGLASNALSFILEDRRLGFLWFGTRDEGVSRHEQDRVPPWAVFLRAPPQLSTSRNQSAVFGEGFGETQGIEFSYRFDGSAWSDWSRIFTWFQNDLPDGTHVLEMRSRDHLANVDSTAAVAVFEIDATPPAPVIASPLFGLPVRGQVEVKGTAADPRFASYRVEARHAGAPSWDPPAAVLIAQSTVPISGATIALWNTSSVTDGSYDLRLSVSDFLGLAGAAQVTVIVDNQAPYADETAPAKVSATTGGDIFTTNSELHLYFPPHAFPDDALVMIAGPAASTDTLPSGAVRVLPGYEISWGAQPLRKAATLEFSIAGNASASSELAVYVSSDGAIWQRLGGTSEEGKISLSVRSPGLYSVFAEAAPPQGSSGLSALSFTPRVFSVADRFANDHVAIGFTLDRSAPVTVRIYNRAGRLVREVISGRVMGPGAGLVRWDGRDRGDVFVADGIYVVTVEALGETRKSTLAVVR